MIARAKAIDTSGNENLIDSVAVVSVNRPGASLNSNFIFDLDEVIEQPTKFSVGTSGAVGYKLEVAPLHGGEWKVLEQSGTEAISSDAEATFDPSLLQNDTYIARLTLFGNGEQLVLEDTVSVAGNLKLGNFRLSFTDLSIPVTGIPITLTRTYDTLNSNETDDFGYGWRMEFRDTDLRTSLKRTEEEELLGRYPAFEDGTKVFITLPGGKREAFTFQAKPLEKIEGMNLGLLANQFYQPTFVSGKGVTSKLTIESNALLMRAADGRFTGLQGQPFNPADRLFGQVYVLTTKDGTKYRIDAKTGDLLTVTDTNGNTLTYTEGAITSSTGQKITFERDIKGRITAVKDPEGELIRYDYDANGDLISVTDQEQNTTRFVYDSTYDDPNYPGVRDIQANDVERERRPHFLREIIDPLGRTGARTEYDDNGRLKATVNAAGGEINLEYDLNNSIQIVRDKAGNPTVYEYDERGNVVRQTNAVGSTTRLYYTDLNNPTSVTKTVDANGLVTEYEYDSKGNLKSKTEEYCGCPGQVPGKTYYTYDASGNMKTLVLPTGASMSMDYDANGNLLTMKDGKGNLIQSFTYYANGLVKTETDTNGTSTYFYDSFGNLTKSIDPDDSITTMSYDFNGNLKRMVEDNGTPDDLLDDEISTFTYDKLGRERKADYGNGIYVEYDYEGASGDWKTLDAPTIGHIERKMTADGKLAGWVTADGGTPSFIYDDLGRLKHETDATGRITTEYGYDAAGRVTSVKDVRTGAIATKQYDAGDRVTEEVDPLGEFTKYEYDTPRNGGKLKSVTRGQYQKDALGNLVLDADGKPVVDTTVALQTTTFEYNGLRTTVIDSLGRRTTSVQDDYSLPTETIFENRNGRNYSSSQKYFYGNNLQEAKDYPTKITDIGGNDRDFTYDTSGRLKTATDLGNGTFTYDYGDDGLEQITSPEGETLRYGYDELGNLSRLTYGDGTFRSLTYDETTNELKTITLASNETITYTSDRTARTQTQTTSTGLNTVSTFTAEGAIKTVTDNTGTTTYHYDQQTQQLSGIDMPNGATVRYTYDLLERVKTLTEKASTAGVAYKTEYDYDTFGNLTWVKDPANGITTMKYDTLNRLTERNLPNGMKTEWSYDALDRIQSVVHKDAQGAVVSSVSYERKDGGEPIKITREDGSYTKLQYDTALRVTNEQFYNAQNVLVDERTYVYDDDGKRIATISSLGNSTYDYSAGYQLDSITSTTGTEDYDYDVNGRIDLMQREGQTLDLDHDVYDRLTAVRNLTNGTTTSYVYDGAGRRVKATSGGNERYFLVTPASGSGLESTDLMFDQGGNITANYVYAGGYSPFMKLDASGNPVYYLTDGMGSVIGLADQSGQNTAKFNYDSFGNIRSQSGSLADTTGGDFRFQGQWLESATGIYHFRARDYDSKSGSFLSRDPIAPTSQQPEAMNPYQAMYNNPYVYSDPSGMISITEIQSAFTVDKILKSIEARTKQEIYERFKDKAFETAGDVFWSVLKTFAPLNSPLTDAIRAIDNAADAGLEFERKLKGQVRDMFADAGISTDQVFLEVGVTQEGHATGNWISFPDTEANIRAGELRPDYVLTPTGSKPRGNRGAIGGPQRSYLIGDIKLQLKTIVNTYIGGDKDGPSNPEQWNAISNYARKNGSRVAGFVTLFGDSANGKQESLEQIAQKAAIKKGFVVFIVSILHGVPYSRKP